MVAKMYYFFKKSLYRYLLAAIILGIVAGIDSYSPLISMIIYFMCIMIVVLPLMYISGRIQARKINFDADISFNESEILVDHRNKDLQEKKDWNWIKNMAIQKERIFLELNEEVPFAISIPTMKLTGEEIEFLKRKAGKTN